VTNNNEEVMVKDARRNVFYLADKPNKNLRARANRSNYNGNGLFIKIQMQRGVVGQATNNNEG
jgi:hypothetical protein